ncbi:MAG: amino acid adenylation domain-containing protein [Pyrinomonadaceae bacterium]
MRQGSLRTYEYNLALRFQRIAEERPGEIAIWSGAGETANYETLNQQANAIARMLLTEGVVEREVVCLSGEKSLYTFAAMIACLKIGAIYCVLDPDTPPARLRKIFGTCRPKVVLGEQDFLENIQSVIDELKIETISKTSSTLIQKISKFDVQNLGESNALTGANPAYIMFTSGSTGVPKGAVMTHANVLNLIKWSRETFGITSADKLTNVNPLFFDNSVFDFFASLFNGAQLVPFSKSEVADPQVLLRKIDAAKCTLWFSVPSLLIFLQTMRATDGRSLRSIRRFIFGGEGYPKSKLKKLYDVYKDSSEFFNVYGPTECTCICSSYQLTDEDFNNLQGLPPLGHIAPNFSFFILAEGDRNAGPDEIGELCLAGPNVGLGYYNDLQRTETSFSQNPLNDRFRELIYRTGDLARLNPADGKLYIEGRKDNQIKHMGYRIELEEIETALYSLEYVSEAVVIHNNVKGLSRLIAVIASPEEIDPDLIRKDLRQIIPGYMIPAVFYYEQILPKNANGKVDRIRLQSQYSEST